MRDPYAQRPVFTFVTVTSQAAYIHPQATTLGALQEGMPVLLEINKYKENAAAATVIWEEFNSSTNTAVFRMTLEEHDKVKMTMAASVELIRPIFSLPSARYTVKLYDALHFTPLDS